MSVPAEKSERDGLTGQYNRETFLKLLGAALAVAEEQGECLSLALLDIDLFSQFDREHGHGAGDRVILVLGNLLKEHLGPLDLLGRYGGEEFVLLFPGCEREQAFLKVETIRKKFESINFGNREDAGARVNLTFSAGISGFPADAATDRDLIHKADEALYRAKVTGRNKVCISQEEKMVTKTSYYSQGQLIRLAKLAKQLGLAESVLLREGLDFLLNRYQNELLESPDREKPGLQPTMTGKSGSENEVQNGNASRPVKSPQNSPRKRRTKA